MSFHLLLKIDMGYGLNLNCPPHKSPTGPCVCVLILSWWRCSEMLSAFRKEDLAEGSQVLKAGSWDSGILGYFLVDRSLKLLSLWLESLHAFSM